MQASPDTIVHWLTNENFASGTYVIKEPGVYKLKEDIIFNPNSVASLNKKGKEKEGEEKNVFNRITSYESGDVLPQQFRVYDPAAFGIGFFAAIAVSSSNVEIDLNGFSIEQSIEHALQQRFFALIQLNSAPFLGGSGPHKFVGDGGLKVPENVLIKNGHLGRSAHHGIHGNDNVGVTIQHVSFENFEIAAIHLNGARKVTIEDCDIRGNRKDIPIYGTFSTGRFLRRYVNHLVSDESPITLTVNGEVLTAFDIQANLKKALNAVWEDLIKNGLPTIDKKKHPDEYALFHNAHGFADGNTYGILINQHDVAINGFSTEKPGEANLANDIAIRNTKIRNIAVAVNEVIGLCNNPILCSEAQKDPIAATWQLWQGHPDDPSMPITTSSFNSSNATYVGNVVTNAQAFVAKAILMGEFVRFPTISIARNSIGRPSVQFVETPDMTMADLQLMVGGFVCNADTMFHVNKGVIGLRIDGASAVSLDNVEIENVTNAGAMGHTECIMHSKDHVPGGEYGGAYARGISLAAASQVSFVDVSLTGVSSEKGPAICIDVQADSSEIDITSVECHKIGAATTVSKETVYALYGGNMNPFPVGVGVRAGALVTGLAIPDTFTPEDLTSPFESHRSLILTEDVPYPSFPSALSDDEKPNILQGVAVTGWNKRKGEAAFILPILGGLFLDVGGVYDESGVSVPIGAGTSCDAFMACYANLDMYFLFFNQPIAERYPNQNVKFDKYESIVRHNSEATTLKMRDQVLWWEKSNGNGVEGITLNTWLGASGTIEFEDCDGEEGPVIHLNVTGAIPGGLYTLWGFFYDQHLPWPRGLQLDFPFGGTSNNVYVADADGSVTATRRASRCISKSSNEERRQLINIFFVFHPDGRVNAAVGHFVNTPPFLGPGCTAIPQIMWSAGGQRLLEPTGCE